MLLTYLQILPLKWKFLSFSKILYDGLKLFINEILEIKEYYLKSGTISQAIMNVLGL